MKKFYSLILFLLVFCTASKVYSQATLPLTNSTFSVAVTGWTYLGAGGSASNTYAHSCYTVTTSRGAKFDTDGDRMMVWFDSPPGTLTFSLSGNSTANPGTSTLLVEESSDEINWTTDATYSVTATTCSAKSLSLNCSSRYVRWTYSQGTYNLDVEAVTITSGGSCKDIIPTLVNGTATPTITITGCASQTATVTYTSTATTFTGTNTFTVELSDAGGDLSSPTSVGTATTTNASGTLTFTVPGSVQAGSYYQIKIISNKPVLNTTTIFGPITIATTCTTNLCPTLTGMVMDGCNGDHPLPCPTVSVVTSCGEGNSEVMFFNSGSYSIPMASWPDGVVKYYPAVASYSPTLGNSPGGKPNNQTGVAITSATTTTGLNNVANTGAGCAGTTFVDAKSVGTIPAHSTFIMVPADFCYTAYDWSALCASTNTIYVVYFSETSSPPWNSSGTLTNYNSTSAIKYLSVDFSWISSCSEQYYMYDVAGEYHCPSTSVGVDGDGVVFPGNTTVSTNVNNPTSPDATAAGTNNGYTTTGCVLPTVLPVSLLNFTATTNKTGNIILNWATATEINNNYFDVEYSLDARHFSSYTQVKGAGTSETRKDYVCPFDLNIGYNAPYFRLKQVDYNGNYKYSNIITLGSSVLPLNTVLVAYYNTNKDEISAKFHLDYPQQVNISLYDITGAKLQETSSLYNEGDNEVSLNAANKTGIYLLVYQAGNGFTIYKKIVVSK